MAPLLAQVADGGSEDRNRRIPDLESCMPKIPLFEIGSIKADVRALMEQARKRAIGRLHDVANKTTLMRKKRNPKINVIVDILERLSATDVQRVALLCKWKVTTDSTKIPDGRDGDLPPLHEDADFIETLMNHAFGAAHDDGPPDRGAVVDTVKTIESVPDWHRMCLLELAATVAGDGHLVRCPTPSETKLAVLKSSAGAVAFMHAILAKRMGLEPTPSAPTWKGLMSVGFDHLPFQKQSSKDPYIIAQVSVIVRDTSGRCLVVERGAKRTDGQSRKTAGLSMMVKSWSPKPSDIANGDTCAFIGKRITSDLFRVAGDGNSPNIKSIRHLGTIVNEMNADATAFPTKAGPGPIYVILVHEVVMGDDPIIGGDGIPAAPPWFSRDSGAVDKPDGSAPWRFASDIVPENERSFISGFGDRVLWSALMAMGNEARRTGVLGSGSAWWFPAG